MIVPIRDWLEREWTQALAYAGDPDRVMDAFVNSEVQSVRYAVLTQLLGKVHDHRRSLLVLKPVRGDIHSWRPRVFARTVVVPWVETHRLWVIGDSDDPYVSNSLRRPHLTANLEGVLHPSEWRRLAAFFGPIDNSVPETVRESCRRCLRSVARRDLAVDD